MMEFELFEILSIAIVFLFFGTSMLILVGLKGAMTWVHWCVFLVLLGLVGMSVMTITTLEETIYLALTGGSWAAAVLLLAVAANIGVWIWNYLNTDGEKFIQ